MTEKSVPPAKRSKKEASAPELLPVEQYRDELLSLVKSNQVCVVCGETGSGKSTYLPKYVLEAGLCSSSKQLAVTQPRRVAAVSIADRVSTLVKTELGQVVGYSVRFDEKFSKQTAIKFVTDGKLLREFLVDRQLSNYGVIMIDEAHERSINTDVLLALLKQLIRVRKDLKVIISSATLDASKFSAFFSNCPVYSLQGRLHDVQIFYTKEIQPNICESSVASVLQICDSEVKGDVLVFLPGLEEISRVEEELKEANHDYNVVCLHGQKSLAHQQAIFKPSINRKIVLATNIAETSITVPNIVHVVDCGLVKQKQMNSLELVRCSQASAKQRAGRAGRTTSGMCFRLFPEHVFELMPSFSKPEILRANLESTLLFLLSMNIDIFRIEFLDKWTSTHFYESLKRLYSLGAINKDAELTKTGRAMNEFPTSPELAKFMVSAIHHSPLVYLTTALAMMIPEFSKYKAKYKAAPGNKLGDWGMLLEVYKDKKLEHARIAQERTQLLRVCMQLRDMCILNKPANTKPANTLEECALQAFKHNVATRNSDGSYTTVDGVKAYIHPRSELFEKVPENLPEKLIYAELVITSKPFLLCCLPLS